MPGSEQRIITINNINGNFHGGFAFIANWNFNDGSTPSTLTVSVVNSDGTYSISDSDLSYQNTVQVSLGSFTFNGYLIGYDKEQSAQQTILTLEYIDKSIDLERWSVGLHNRHGFLASASDGMGSTDSIPKRMILVGREYSPCDDQLDSTTTFSAQSTGKIDPCDPCPNMPANGYKNACQDEVKHLKILPVYYTFNELLNKINTVTGLIVTLPTDMTGAISNHRAQHTGVLKTVLSTWCSELGLSYYYDPVSQKLVFINRSAPISIPDETTLSGTKNTVSLKYGATKSKTFSRGFIGYIGTQGEIKNYNCEREDAATLYALTLADLLTPDTGAQNAETLFNVKAGGTYEKNYTYHPPTNGPQTGQRTLDDMTALYYSTALAYYPSQLRLSFLWFELLGIYDQDVAKTWRVSYTAPDGTPTAPNPDGSAPNGSTIYELGNMNIVKVISKQDDATAYIFDCLARLGSDPYGALVPDSYLQYVEAEDKADGRDPENDPSFYFILAQCNTDLLNKQEQRDTSRAKQFLGRYYYREFDKMAVAGGSNDNNQLNIDAAGASATYHPRGEYIQQLPIFSFGHTGKSRVGKITQVLGANESDNLTSMGNSGSNATSGDAKYRSLKSFILLDRSDAAKYSPDEAHFEDWHDTWEWYQNTVPHLMGNDGRPDILTKKLDPAQAGADSSLKLFLVRSVKKEKYKVTATAGVPHPSESKTMKTRSASYEGVGGNTTNGTREYPADGDTNATYGLASANTVEIKMPAGLTIYPPAQSIVFDGMAEAGFRVFIKSSSKYQKVVPKFQKVVYKDAANPDDAAQVDYVYKELTSENLEILTNQQNCLPTDGDINNYVSKFAPHMAVSNTTVCHKANLKLLGVMPAIFTVAQGLASVQITVGDNGVYTDYTFEDKIIVPPAEDIIADQIIRQNRIAPTLGSSLQKMTSQQYTDVQTAGSAAKTFNTAPIKVT